MTRRATDAAIAAHHALTRAAFGSLIDEQPLRAQVRLVPVAPHVHADATERAVEAIARTLRPWLHAEAPRWAARIATYMAVLPEHVDPREHVEHTLYRADQRCLLRAGQRVAPVLRAYAGALEEHARVLRADVMCRGVSREIEAEARRSEVYAASVRGRTGL